MFPILTAETLLQEERARVIRDDLLERIETDIAHGLAPELAIASYVADEEIRARLQRQIVARAGGPAGPKQRLLAYPHDPFK
jgi:hypothetical protein